MAEIITGIKRTRYAGELRAGDNGAEVVVCGWVQRVRRLGGLIFVTVRDRTGLIQCNFNSERDRALYDKADTLRSEYVVAVRGAVALRGDEARNPNMPTGEVEVVVRSWKLLNTSKTPPFIIEDRVDPGENLRLQYRYLDLLRSRMEL